MVAGLDTIAVEGLGFRALALLAAARDAAGLAGGLPVMTVRRLAATSPLTMDGFAEIAEYSGSVVAMEWLLGLPGGRGGGQDKAREYHSMVCGEIGRERFLTAWAESLGEMVARAEGEAIGGDGVLPGLEGEWKRM